MNVYLVFITAALEIFHSWPMMPTSEAEESKNAERKTTIEEGNKRGKNPIKPNDRQTETIQ